MPHVFPNGAEPRKRPFNRGHKVSNPQRHRRHTFGHCVPQIPGLFDTANHLYSTYGRSGLEKCSRAGWHAWPRDMCATKLPVERPELPKAASSITFALQTWQLGPVLHVYYNYVQSRSQNLCPIFGQTKVPNQFPVERPKSCFPHYQVASLCPSFQTLFPRYMCAAQLPSLIPVFHLFSKVASSQAQFSDKQTLRWLLF